MAGRVALHRLARGALRRVGALVLVHAEELSWADGFGRG
jgi:hypothetical protein